MKTCKWKSVDSPSMPLRLEFFIKQNGELVRDF